MKKLVLYAQGYPEQQPDPDILGVIWESGDAPAGCLSLPEIMRAQLLEIRAEHMRWAFEMGFLPVAHSDLQTYFECGAAPSMWWTSTIYERHPKLCPSLYEIYKLRCLEKLLDAHDCGELELRKGDKKLRSVVGALCHSRGIKFSAPDKGRPGMPHAGFIAKIYAATPAPLRALVRLVHWWWTIKRKLPTAGGEEYLTSIQGIGKSRKPATIVTYFPNIDLKEAAQGRFRSRYWEKLHDALDGQAHAEGGQFVHWLFIRFPSPQLTFEQCLQLCKSFAKDRRDGLDFHYLEEFLTAGDMAAALLRWLKLGCRSILVQRRAARAFHFYNSSLNFWPYMKNSWAESFRGWRCLERCLQNMAFRRYCRLSGPQRWRLFPLENCPWERMLADASRAASPETPVYGAQHSIIRPTDFRYFDDPRTFARPVCKNFQPDIIGGNGRSAEEQLLGNGLPAARFRMLEALRYLYIPEMRQTAKPEAWQNELPPDAGEPLAPYSPKKLLVLTSFFADETEAHLKLLAQAFDAGLLTGWSITIKPHPYLSIEDWLASLPGQSAKKIRIATGPLAMELKPGIKVWASNSTTASLEAALLGLPLMVMAPCNDFDLCPIQDVPGLARTGCLADVRAHLENMTPLALAENYLDLDSGLTGWSRLLGLNYQEKQPIIQK